MSRTQPVGCRVVLEVEGQAAGSLDLRGDVLGGLPVFLVGQAGLRGLPAEGDGGGRSVTRLVIWGRSWG